MEDETKDIPALEETEETTEEVVEEQEEDETDWKSEAQKAKELADNYKKRAEKAEKKAKSAPTTKEETSNLSPKDYLALQEAGITAQDFDEVQDFANYRKVSLAEALESSTLRTILAERKEERATAQATSTKGARGTKPKSGDDYLEKAKTTGEIPTDDKALQDLILAKQNARRTRK